MGCDIHFYVERQLTDGTWVVIPPPNHDPIKWPKQTKDVDERYVETFKDWWGPDECMHTYECFGTSKQVDGKWIEVQCEGTSCVRCAGTGRELNWWRSRNYTLFGVLAHVRNREYPPISKLRGLPEDLSDALRASELLIEDHPKRRSDIHSQSWLTFAEVFDFNWASWDVDYADRFVTFKKFLEQIVKPEMCDEYHRLRAVYGDLVEEIGHEQASKHALREQIREIEKTYRFVFGFDN